jgi:hypothetical protein
VNTKYISIKIEPKGRMPAAGMMKLGSAYQEDRGMGLGDGKNERRVIRQAKVILDRNSQL